jgi:hypothetical protein
MFLPKSILLDSYFHSFSFSKSTIVFQAFLILQKNKYQVKYILDKNIIFDIILK